MSMDGVKVHQNSSKPAEVGAHAYAQGTDIHVAPGQMHHLPHEAWHVVQQAQGRVQPTTSVAGMPVNDSSSLENEADVMGAKALQRASVDDAAATTIQPLGNGGQLQRTPVLQAQWTTLEAHEPDGLIRWENTEEDLVASYSLADGWYKSTSDFQTYWAIPLDAEQIAAIRSNNVEEQAPVQPDIDPEPLELSVEEVEESQLAPSEEAVDDLLEFDVEASELEPDQRLTVEAGQQAAREEKKKGLWKRIRSWFNPKRLLIIEGALTIVFGLATIGLAAASGAASMGISAWTSGWLIGAGVLTMIVGAVKIYRAVKEGAARYSDALLKTAEVVFGLASSIFKMIGTGIIRISKLVTGLINALSKLTRAYLTAKIDKEKLHNSLHPDDQRENHKGWSKYESLLTLAEGIVSLLSLIEGKTELEIKDIKSDKVVADAKALNSEMSSSSTAGGAVLGGVKTVRGARKTDKAHNGD
jgi:hypothetical protein